MYVFYIMIFVPSLHISLDKIIVIGHIIIRLRKLTYQVITVCSYVKLLKVSLKYSRFDKYKIMFNLYPS